MASVDVPNAFIWKHVLIDPSGERIVTKIREVLLDWLVELYPVARAKYIRYENGKKVLHLEVLREMYGMWIASLLWYRKSRKDLEGIGFEFTNCYPHFANRMIDTRHQPVHFHLDDILVYREESKVSSDFLKWSQ